MVAAAVHFFKMSDVDDSPSSSAFPSDIAQMDVDGDGNYFMRKWKILSTGTCHLSSLLQALCLVTQQVCQQLPTRLGTQQLSTHI